MPSACRLIVRAKLWNLQFDTTRESCTNAKAKYSSSVVPPDPWVHFYHWLVWSGISWCLQSWWVGWVVWRKSDPWCGWVTNCIQGHCSYGDAKNMRRWVSEWMSARGFVQRIIIRIFSALRGWTRANKYVLCMTPRTVCAARWIPDKIREWVPGRAAVGTEFLSPYSPHTHTHGDPHTHGRPGSRPSGRQLKTPDGRKCWAWRKRVLNIGVDEIGYIWDVSWGRSRPPPPADVLSVIYPASSQFSVAEWRWARGAGISRKPRYRAHACSLPVLISRGICMLHAQYKLNVPSNNCFRGIFNGFWRESVKPLLFYCNTIHSFISSPQNVIAKKQNKHRT